MLEEMNSFGKTVEIIFGGDIDASVINLQLTNQALMFAISGENI